MFSINAAPFSLQACTQLARPSPSCVNQRAGRRRRGARLQPRATQDAEATSTSGMFGVKIDTEDPALQTRKNPDLYAGLQGSAAGGAELASESSSTVTAMIDLQPLKSNGSSGSSAAPQRVSAASAIAGLHKPEVLSPAGGWPQLISAVENGADAVYFGLSDFNARARAANFSPEELPTVMRYLHQRGVKGYAAVNVLVFDEELPRLQERARTMALAGVDAVIVQDLGAVQLLRAVAPSLPVHGSTQMSITSSEGAEFARALGVERVVVGRELSLREISQLHRGTSAEVEAFVHGAMCVSYSGQCFSSEAWGGRSANRGQCAQACRMPYGLIVNGTIRELGDVQYLLSPQDLMAVEQVPDLISAGVSCFKIEGRLKGPEYVAATTQVYRRAIDAAWDSMMQQQQQQEESSSSNGAAVSTAPATSPAAAAAGVIDAAQLAALRQVFARGQDGEHGGLTPGFLEGVQHQRLVRGRSPRHRGVYLGQVEAVLPRKGVVVRLAEPVNNGDGVVFDAGTPQEKEQGGSVFGVEPWGAAGNTPAPSAKGRGKGGKGGSGWDGSGSTMGAGSAVLLTFGRGQLDLDAVKPGDLAWRTKDPALEAQLRRSFEGLSAAEQRKLPVDVTVSGRLGTPLQLTLRDRVWGCQVVAQSEGVLQAAERRPMSEDDVARGVGQLGGNCLAPASVDASGLELARGLFLPASELKAVRNRASEQLLEAVAMPRDTAAGLRMDDVLPELTARVRQAAVAARTSAATAAAAEVADTVAAAAAQTTASGAETAVAAEAAGAETAAAGAMAAAVLGGSSSRGGASVQQEAGRASRLRVLCRSRQQVEAALQLPWLDELVLDFLEVHGLKEAVAQVQQAGRRCVVATPRILKPDEQRLWLFYLKLGADALLVRSAGMLQALQSLGSLGAQVPGTEGWVAPPLEGDFSLNASNSLTAHLLLAGGLEVLAPTHDCNAAQVAGMARALGPGPGSSSACCPLEVILHQHVPIFHTEHCVFCRFLSDGNSYKDCGHPCETNALHLRDEKGHDHLVLADMGCRNTVFNSQAQSGLHQLPQLLSSGLRRFRVELVDEQPQHVPQLLQGYRDVLDGRRSASDLWRWMGTLPDANGRVHGVAAGSLGVKAERDASSLRPTARR